MGNSAYQNMRRNVKFGGIKYQHMRPIIFRETCQ